jgi:hypothetical protein
MTERCACGRPLHYTDPDVEEMVRALVAMNGEYVSVMVGNRVWLVQRHYIALHGLNAGELETQNLFREITCN